MLRFAQFGDSISAAGANIINVTSYAPFSIRIAPALRSALVYCVVLSIWSPAFYSIRFIHLISVLAELLVFLPFFLSFEFSIFSFASLLLMLTAQNDLYMAVVYFFCECVSVCVFVCYLPFRNVAANIHLVTPVMFPFVENALFSF